MNKKILIVGTGKMAEDIGLFFIGKGADVLFVTSSDERVNGFNLLIEKRYNRIKRIKGDDFVSNYLVKKVNEIDDDEFDFVIESTTENLEVKREKISQLKSVCPNILLFTNSSSIKSELIDNDMIGMHFFYPVELTGIVEIINDKNEIGKKTAEFFGLKVINESEDRAFLVNRLLLPLQAEALRLLQNGYGADIIDSSSSNELLIKGQLSMIDSIGVDTVLSGVVNYISYVDKSERCDYSALVNGLETLVKNGVLGNKNKKEIMECNNLPWPQIKADMHPRIAFNLVLINNCLNYINKELTNFDELDMIFTNIFMSDISLSDLLRQINFKNSVDTLKNLFERENISYFKPSPMWDKGMEICD